MMPCCKGRDSKDSRVPVTWEAGGGSVGKVILTPQ